MKKAIMTLVGLAACTPNYDRIGQLEGQLAGRMSRSRETGVGSLETLVPEQGAQYSTVCQGDLSQEVFTLLIYHQGSEYKVFMDHSPAGLRVEDKDKVVVVDSSGVNPDQNQLTESTEAVYNEEFGTWLESIRAIGLFKRGDKNQYRVTYTQD